MRTQYKNGDKFVYNRAGFPSVIYTLCHLEAVGGWILVSGKENTISQWMAVTPTAESAFGNCEQYFIPIKINEVQEYFIPVNTK